MAASFTASDLLGFASIGCWLGAQFPQVLENIRRQSCEGLALPFLANWLLGDISNLVGCILTHQLPFQTWLATYFVIVDCMLVSQYFYYYKPPPKTLSHFGHVRGPVTPGTSRRLSIDRGASRYRTLSAVAANVAAAAALAAQQEEQQPESAKTIRPVTYGTDDTHTSLRPSVPGLPDDQDEDEEPAAALADSFYSEGGRSLGGRKQISWSVERRGASVGRYPPLPRSTTPTTLHYIFPDAANRASESSHPVPPVSAQSESESEVDRSAGRRNSRASRRGATMVFLGTWALFGIGTLAGSNRRVPSSSAATVGRLLLPREVFSPNIPVAAVPGVREPIPTANIGNSVLRLRDTESELDHDDIVHGLAPLEDETDEVPLPHEPPEEEPPYERVLGRIFAWLCTTLYLTSRLPQIWKNFVRKSVEGLSMYLFVFAFLGNFFYVSSILFSPKAYLPPPLSTEFIRESIPYLLGSGGTLMFDITIVTQSFIYRPRHKRHSTSHIRISEEEAGLLSSDALHPPLSTGESAIMNRGRALRTRSVG